MKLWWSWISLFFLCLPTAGQASTEFVKADVYYYGWNVQTRGALSLDNVRQNPKTRTNILDRNETIAFVRSLQLERMRKSTSGKNTWTEDPRLVIDLWDINGERTTYYSGRNYLISEDGSQGHGIDGSFRQKFSFVPGQ